MYFKINKMYFLKKLLNFRGTSINALIFKLAIKIYAIPPKFHHNNINIEIRK